jgi:UPF0755 protein
MGRWLLRLASLATSFLIVAAMAAVWGWSAFRQPGPLPAPANVVIPRGAGLEAIARQLAEAGVIADTTLFSLGAKISGKARGLKAGEFRFPAAVSPEQALAILERGETVVRRVTVAEGLTSVQVVALLGEAEGLDGTIDAVPPEGSLLPETYHYSWGDDREMLVRRMERSMRETLARLWEGRAGDLPFETPEEALVLASIVERETGVADERGLVAGVFVNRLKRGMRLQSDPTVAYGIAGGDGLDRPLTRADLRAATPYNTYVIAGLPPGPICNPGLASLEAVLRPAETDYLYFVADGTGGHAFAKTLAEHNRNVRKWRRLQR